ncbi:MAG: hypothetical protein DRQ55_15570 [Planctomycetota bacterium]|nr:MAG: hypothetical protein DRQ55_15570 [Planctomycetota bacterium]
MTALRNAALAYAKLGWQVLPLHGIRDGSCSCGKPACSSPGKHPRTEHGVKDATDDVEHVELWWSRWPDANIGIATGESSGFWVLDIDMKVDQKTGEVLKDGEAALRDAGLDVHSNVEGCTGGGGRHLIFAWDKDAPPVGCSSGSLPKDCDVRGNGGYIVAPPSTHASGVAYCWRSSPMDGDPGAASPALLSAVLGVNRAAPLSVVARGTLPAVAAPAAPERVDPELAKALAAIPPAVGYENWIAVGMALHDETHGSEAGFALFHGWSARAAGKQTPSGKDAYSGEPSCRKKWRSFKSRSNPIGRASLFDLAIKHGFSTATALGPPSSRPRASKPEEGATHSTCGSVVPAWKPFPTHLLPTPLQELAEEGAAAIGCDPSAIALPALATAAGAIGNARRVRIKASWSEPLVIWAVFIGLSGKARKSPAIELATRPLWEAQLIAAREFEQEIKKYEKKSAAFEARKRGRGEKAAAVLERAEPPTVPTCKRFVVRDPTIEALAPILKENPRGLLLARDELSAWLGGFNQYKAGRAGSDVANWLEMHGAGQLLVDRRTGRSMILVPRAAVSLTGMIQPRVLKDSLNPQFMACGLAARLLFAHPPTTQRRWSDAEVSSKTTESMARTIQRLQALELDLDPSGAPVPSDIRMSGEALEMFKAFVDRHGLRTTDADDDVAAAMAKIEGYAARLAGVIHLARLVNGNDVASDELDGKSMRCGIALADWFAYEADRAYALLVETEGAADQRGLIELVRARGGRITARELTAARRKYRAAGTAKKALDDLVTQEIGEWVEQKPAGPGRPSTVFVLRPSPSEGGADALVVAPSDDNGPPDPGCTGESAAAGGDGGSGNTTPEPASACGISLPLPPHGTADAPSTEGRRPALEMPATTPSVQSKAEDGVVAAPQGARGDFAAADSEPDHEVVAVTEPPVQPPGPETRTADLEAALASAVDAGDEVAARGAWAQLAAAVGDDVATQIEAEARLDAAERAP